MRVVYDTNVVIDAIAERGNFSAAQKMILYAAEDRIEGLITANTVTDIHYILKKRIGDQKAREAIENLLTVFQVTAVNGAICEEALDIPMKDYEDAVLAVSAREAGADYIATVDKAFMDESSAPVKAFGVDRLLSMIEPDRA